MNNKITTFLFLGSTVLLGQYLGPFNLSVMLGVTSTISDVAVYVSWHTRHHWKTSPQRLTLYHTRKQLCCRFLVNQSAVRFLFGSHSHMYI